MSHKKREKVLDLYDTASDEQREKLRELLRDLSVILRVASSSRKIRVKEFHKFNQETYENLLLLFPWMDIQDSVHGLFHSAQFIEKFNDSYGLAQLSESALGKFKATFILNSFPYW